PWTIILFSCLFLSMQSLCRTLGVRRRYCDVRLCDIDTDGMKRS
ncbi:uncharacterized, partial [Tachysurus ichikawai]